MSESAAIVAVAISTADPTQIDATLDLIFDWTDTQFKAGHFDLVDALLSAIAVESVDEDLLVGCICATFCARHKLTQRVRFIDRTREHLASHHDADEIHQMLDEIGG